MATQKPISTISYNTESFLREKLESWVSAHIIQAYMYIRHKGEDGDKDHIHLHLIPNKKLDPMDLAEELREFVITNDKPLGVRPFRPSKEEDWILYAVHDPEYMKLKYPMDPKEKIPYDWKDIKSSADFDVETAFIRAKSKMKHSPSSIATRLKSGENPINLTLEGENPFLVRSITALLSATDYQRLNNSYLELQHELQALMMAIDSAGLLLQYDEDGNPMIVHKK